MRFGVFAPPQAKERRVPVLFFLAGLTCTEETFAMKAGAQRLAAAHGLMIVTPDTSPREARHPGDDESWDFGLGAGFYLDAQQSPWKANYRMYRYVVEELPMVIAEQFAADAGRLGIFGHSMGGHGALVCALRNQGKYRSVSAFAPVCAPSECPWGEKALARYLGSDRGTWGSYDSVQLIAKGARLPGLLVDQGLSDQFLDEQLKVDRLEAVCRASGQPLTLRRHAGYDHSYYFISSFVEEHIAYHAARLQA